MIPLSVLLKHYKRKDIQEEMIEHAKDREIAVRFNDKFGKRPDVLKYPSDIIELAKQGATSFHASEELWKNPLRLNPDMKKRELDDLRVGWDLVLDIDCPYWEYSKLITNLMIKSLKKHGVKSISCKYSGNKGFHVGVPFEAFPLRVGDREARFYFPEEVRILANYLIDYIDNKNNNFEFTNIVQQDKSLMNQLKSSVKEEEIFKIVCRKCGAEAKKREFVYGCFKCGNVKQMLTNELMKCDICGSIMKKTEALTRLPKIAVSQGKNGYCSACGPTDIYYKFNISLILSVDAILISSRHLYRMPYSLHEKSGLCSIPVDPDSVLKFDKIVAEPENVQVSRFRFLDNVNIEKDNAKNLFDEAHRWFIENRKMKELQDAYFGSAKKTYEEPTVALDEQFFPPCIKAILSGLSDGRKRALFTLTNFLSKLGWSAEQIEKRLKEWNAKNEEPLREVYIVSQLRYYQQRKEKILPPNCDNKAYYTDMRVCHPDNLCSKIKNPVNYAVRKARYIENKKKG